MQVLKFQKVEKANFVHSFQKASLVRIVCKENVRIHKVLQTRTKNILRVRYEILLKPVLGCPFRGTDLPNRGVINKLYGRKLTQRVIQKFDDEK